MGYTHFDQRHHFRCTSHLAWESTCASTSWKLPGNGWHEETYAFETGKTKFVSANISSGISITQSFAAFHQEYEATISYDFPVAILGFGIRGHNSYSINNKSSCQTLRPGDVILYRPDDAPITRKASPQQNNQSAALKFDQHRICDLLEELRDLGERPDQGSMTTLRLGENLATAKLLQPLINNPFGCALDRLMAESAALSLLVSCLETPKTYTLPHSENISLSERKSLSRAIELLLSDLTTPPDLYSLAAEAGMSHTRLNRCFRKAYGCTIFAWLRAYRLDIAKKMLRNDKHSITEIAFLCGFSSASHFGSTFRAQNGCTPQDFRHHSAI